ncbi:hypothetical protein M3570_21340, partial [Bacillus subtilis]|nr:hypothetical protein [Bacillus subtilis]
GLREALRDTAREAAGADEAEAGWVRKGHGSGCKQKRSNRQYRRNDGGVVEGRLRSGRMYELPVGAAICTQADGRYRSGIRIMESDPEMPRACLPLETSASCLEFVIVHYACWPVARAGSGKTDRPSCCDPTPRTESRDPQGSSPAPGAAPRGGSGRVQLQ